MKQLFVFCLGVLILAGCAGSKGKVEKKPAARAAVRGLENLDESFDPAELKEPPYPIQPKVEKDKNKILNLLQTTNADTSRAREILGYRVQILQTEDAQEARLVQKDAILGLDADVYLIYDNPYYKLRVGDFENRYEAENFLEKVVKKGYASAWIVRTKIKSAFEKKNEGSSQSPEKK